MFNRVVNFVKYMCFAFFVTIPVNTVMLMAVLIVFPLIAKVVILALWLCLLALHAKMWKEIFEEGPRFYEQEDPKTKLGTFCDCC